MPQSLPNGLVCPEKNDNSDQACQNIKDLFVAVDALQTAVGAGGGGNINKITQDITAGNWTLVGPVKCKVYRQTLTVPSGITTSDMLLQIYDDDAIRVNLTVTVVGPTTIIVETNNPVTYTAVYA